MVRKSYLLKRKRFAKRKSYGKRKASTKRPKRVAYKRKQRRVRGKVSRHNATAATLASKLLPINSLVYSNSGIATLAASTALSGPKCTYFVCPGHDQVGGVNSLACGTLSVMNLCNIAGKISSAAGNLNQRYYLHRSSIEYELVNQSNAVQWLEAYCCVARRDIPDSGTNVPQLMTNGFVTAGIPFADIGSQDYTLFDSVSFVQQYRIKSVEKFKLGPGASKKFRLIDSKKRLINTGHFIRETLVTDTILSAVRYFTELKDSMFYAFRWHTQLLDDTVTNTKVGTGVGKILFQVHFDLNYQTFGVSKGTVFRDAPTGYGDIVIGNIVENDGDVEPVLTA